MAKTDQQKEPENTSESSAILPAQTDSAASPDSGQAAGADSAAAQAAREAEPAPSEPSEEKPPRQKLSKTAVLALLIALLALGLGGWLFYQGTLLKQEAAALQAELDRVRTEAQQVAGGAREQSGALQGQIQQLERQLGQDRQGVSQLQQRLTQSMQQVQQQLAGTSRSDWLLAEVEYLLRLANQRILMERTASGALSLLNSADAILKETDDVAIFDVRKALAKDIAALQSVPRVDTEGLFLKMSALDEQVEKLRLIPVTDRHKLPNLVDQFNADAAASWGASLQEGWSNTMDKLSKLVVVQHRDEPVEPLMSPEQTYYLKQNLHLMLQQAQMALLQGEQASYDNSLQKALAWVETYFAEEDATTQGMLQGLKSLQGVQVAPELPDISASLKTLKNYLKTVHGDQAGGAA